MGCASGCGPAPPRASPAVRPELAVAERLAEDLEDRRRGTELGLRLAENWGRLEPSAADAFLHELADKDRGPDIDAALSAAADLRNRALYWPPEEKGAARNSAARLERVAFSGRALIGAAERWSKTGGAGFDDALRRSIRVVRGRRNGRGRDLGLARLAPLAAVQDPGRAFVLAGAARSPEIESRAWRLTAAAAARRDEAYRTFCLGKAFEAAADVSSVAGRVRALSALAADWRRTDPEASDDLFGRALALADGLEEPDRRAGLVSLVGARWGGFQADRAFAAALILTGRNRRQRAELFLGAARKQEAPEARRSLARAAYDQALGLETIFERERLTAAAAGVTASQDPRLALRRHAETSPGGNPHWDRVLAAAGLSLAGDDPDGALEAADLIGGNAARVMYLAALAEAMANRRADLAAQALSRADLDAAGLAEDRPRADLAAAWTALDAESALQKAAMVESPGQRSRACAMIAARLSRAGREAEADRAWRAALEAAAKAGGGPGRVRAAAYMNIGLIREATDPGQAAEAYQTAGNMLTG